MPREFSELGTPQEWLKKAKSNLALAKNPKPHASKKLTDKEGYHIRVGNYRILYTIDDKAKVVVIYRIKIRGEVYK